MQPLTFEASVLRLARLAARLGGTLTAEDVERDEVLARDHETTAAAAHLLAGGTNVVSTPPEEADSWFPYGELTFTRPLAELPE
jgi:hypothetical protein